MRLIESSEPGEVDRSDAIHLLSERAVLTRAVCRELIDQAHRGARGWRAQSALTLLLQWVDRHFPGSSDLYSDVDRGLDRMVVPDGCLEVMREIRSGTQVAAALAWSYTADSCDLKDDLERLREKLEAYWAKHAEALAPPQLGSL